MSAAQELSPDWCLHPGELLAEVLEKRGLRQSELAERTGLSAKHVNQMIKQLIGISPDVAILLERALGTPANFWIQADADYQTFASRRRAATALNQYQQWADQFDRAALERHHIIDSTDSGVTMVEKVLKFFQVATPAAFEQIWLRPSVSIRRSQAFTIDEPNTALWLRLVERFAADIEAAPFNPRQLRKVARTIPRLTTMSVPNGFIAARAELADAGVALTFVREVDRTRACAATRWIAPDRPAIGITERHRKPDVFWFNLLHEIGHIILHPRRTSYLNLDTDERRTDPTETEADAFAADILFPGDTSDLISRARSHQELILIAARLGVGVATVAGRHGNLTGKWNVAGRLRGKITDDDVLTLETAVENATA
jgi:HTH-type transcriptional regulator/antitoxin HigA